MRRPSAGFVAAIAGVAMTIFAWYGPWEWPAWPAFAVQQLVFGKAGADYSELPFAGRAATLVGGRAHSASLRLRGFLHSSRKKGTGYKPALRGVSLRRAGDRAIISVSTTTVAHGTHRKRFLQCAER